MECFIFCYKSNIQIRTNIARCVCEENKSPSRFVSTLKCSCGPKEAFVPPARASALKRFCSSVSSFGRAEQRGKKATQPRTIHAKRFPGGGLGLHEAHLGCLASQTYLGAPGFSEWEPPHYV